jgi:hypothetical protein
VRFPPRLIAAIDSKPDGFSQCETMEDIGRKLLQSVGTPDGEITSEMCVEAVAANDSLVAALEAIRDKALLAAAVEGEMN